MKSKRAILISCMAAMALLASPVFGEPPRHSAGGRAMISSRNATARVARSYPRYSNSRYGGMRYYGNNWRHHRHFGGTQFFFYSGYPYGYGYYPYSWGWPWGYDDYYPYSYGYYYNNPGYAYSNGYSSDAVVARVQQHLADQGYFNDAIDGVLGPQTRAAIRAYERSHGMATDGIVSNRLLSRMGVR